MRRPSWFPILAIIPLPIVLGIMFAFPVEDLLHPVVYVNMAWIAGVLITQQIYHRRSWHICKHCGHHRYMHDPKELVDFPSLIKIVCKQFDRSYGSIKPNYYDLGWRDDK